MPDHEPGPSTSSHTDNRGTRRRIASMVLWLLLVLALIPALAILTVNLPPVKSRVIPRLEKLLSEQVIGDVMIGDYRTDLFTTTRVTGMRIRGRDEDSITVAHFVWRYRLLELLNRRIVVTDVYMSDVLIHGVRTQTGEVLLPVLPVEPPEPDPDEPEWDFEVGSVSIDNMVLSFSDRMTGSFVVVRDVAVRASPHLPDSVQAEIRTGSGRLHVPGYSTSIDSTHLALSASMSVAEIIALDLRTSEAVVSGKGRVPLSEDTTWDFTAQARVLLPALAQILDALPSDPGPQGSLGISVNIRGQATAPSSEVVIESDRIRYGEWSADSLRLRVTIEQGQQTRISGFVWSELGEVRIDGLADLEGTIPQIELGRYDLTVSAREIDVGQILTRPEWTRHGPFPGHASICKQEDMAWGMSPSLLD